VSDTHKVMTALILFNVVFICQGSILTDIQTAMLMEFMVEVWEWLCVPVNIVEIIILSRNSFLGCLEH
jgi:hypothetical protein